MLKSNKVNLIIALIVAIVLWSYVLLDVNQSSSQTIKNVPITILNEDTLTDEGLVILSMDYEKINITYSCQRQELRKIKDSDFTVTADVEGLRKGETKLRLSVSGPDDVNIENISVEKITVTVDELASAKKKVETVIVNQMDDESEPSIEQMSFEEVTVTGAKTLVDSVVSVQAQLDASKVSGQMKSLTVELAPVDKNGATVSNLSLSQSNVSITAIMLNKKTVTLDVPVTGTEHASFSRSVSVPKTITIKAGQDLLDDIESISCEELDLSEIYEDAEIKLDPILPEGVTVASESENLYATVTVKGVESKTFTFSETDVVLEGVTEDETATVGDISIKVTVTAKSEDMDDITAEDFDLTADISDMDEGEHIAKLDCTLSKSHTDMNVSTSEVTVTIAKVASSDKQAE